MKAQTSIELTDDQEKSVKDLLDKAREEYCKGNKGIVIAQIYRRDDGRVFANAAYLEHESASRVIEICDKKKPEIQDKIEELIFELDRSLEKMKNYLNAVPHR